MQQADGFVVDPRIAPTLKSGETGAIRRFLKEYAEYVRVWTERINEGVIPRRRAPKTMLRCTDLELRERIRKYDLQVGDGEELEEQALRQYGVKSDWMFCFAGCVLTRLRRIRVRRWDGFFNTSTRN